MRDLQYIISDCFQSNDSNYGFSNRRYTSNIDDSIVYMEVPIDNEDFEIPVFAVGQLNQQYVDTELVITLKYIGIRTTYKALDTGLRDIMTTNFDNNRFIKIPVKEGEPIYYGTYGAIFDKDFKPVAMLMWEIRKVYDEEGNFKYKFVKPILRVCPSVFINKSNSVERYIINKLIPAALGNHYIYRPDISGTLNDEQYRYILNVDIGEFSFKMKKPAIPTISTTNGKLLKVALDNLDELVQ